MKNDRTVLREVAKKYLEIARNPVQDKRRERYRRFNDMEDVGHMVLIEPDADGVWQELIPEDMLQASDPLYREYEFLLRCLIYHANNFHDDKVFEPYLSMDMSGEYTGYHYGVKKPKNRMGLVLVGYVC